MSPRLPSRTIELRRVVVTGLGAVTPLGMSEPETWKAAVEGACGISRLPGEEMPGLATRLVANVEGEIPAGDLPQHDAQVAECVEARPLLHRLEERRRLSGDERGRGDHGRMRIFLPDLA